MEMFDINKITKVYSGRKGCACGCRGKYSYASAYKDERPSYLEGEEDISDRSVKAIARKVEQLLHDRPEEVDALLYEPDFIAVDLEHDRTYTVYFAQ